MRVVDPAVLAAFQAGYSEAAQRWGSVPPPLVYLEQADVYALVRRGKMIGGFAINRRAPWRYVAAIPGPDQADWTKLLALRERVAELTAVWLDAEHRRSWRYVALWAYVLWASRGHDVLCGTRRESLAREYRAVLRPVREYHGPLGFAHLTGGGWVMLADGVPLWRRAVRAARAILRRRRKHG